MTTLHHSRSSLHTLWRALPAARRREGLFALGLMLVAAIAELLSVSAVIPFLAILMEPDTIQQMPVVGRWTEWLPDGPELVGIASLAFVGLFLISGIIRLLLAWVSQGFSFNAAYDLSIVAFRRIVEQPYQFYLKENSASLISKFEKINIVTYSVLLAGVQAFISTIIAALLILLLLVIDPLVAVASASIIVGAYVLTTLFVRAPLSRNSEIIAHSWAARVKYVQEALGGIRDVLLDRSQATFEADFRRNADRLRRALTINAYIGISPRILIEVIGMALVGGVTWYLAQRPEGIASAIPKLGAFVLAAQRLLPLLQSAYNGWSQFFGSGRSVYEVAELIRLPKSPAASEKSASCPFEREIVFDHVSFAYQPGRSVLHGVSFTVNKGDRIGIIGETGSGKSTLVDLLLGLLEPTEGAILVDGEILDNPRRIGWQKRIAHVPQTIYLADDTLAANIAFGVAPDAVNDDEVERAARLAGIHEVVVALPERYQTFVGERGVRLSGGQRQRIGIARALYKRATVLVLDEATSALDSATENSVMRSIEMLSAEITMFIIAHRSTPLRSCNRIICLESGKLVKIVNSVDELREGAARPGCPTRSRPLERRG